MIRFHPCLLLLPLLVLTACTSAIKQSAEEIEQRYYVFSPEKPPQAPPTLDALLKVKRVDSSPALAGRTLVYRTRDRGVITDYYNLFHSPPVDLLTAEITRTMKESGPFAFVADRSTDARPDYILESNLVTLFGDYRSPEQPKAVLEMQFFLLHDTEYDYEILMNLELREEIPLADTSPDELVRGYDRALAAILDTLVREVDAAAR